MVNVGKFTRILIGIGNPLIGQYESTRVIQSLSENDFMEPKYDAIFEVMKDSPIISFLKQLLVQGPSWGF